LAENPERVHDAGSVDLKKALQGYKRSEAYGELAENPERVHDAGSVDLKKALQGY
jgi:hypothetical protein